MRLATLATHLSAAALILVVAGCRDTDDADISAPGPLDPGSAEAAEDKAIAASLDNALAVEPPSKRLNVFPENSVSDAQPLGASEEATLEDLGCFFVAGENGPNKGSDVECELPHGSEKYGKITMDESWPAEYAAYKGQSEVYERWFAWADAQCAELLSEAVGGEPVRSALGVDAPILPAWTGWYGEVLPEDLWNAGSRVTHCWVAAEPGVMVSGRWVSRLMSSDRPDELSMCWAKTDAETVAQTACSQPHFAEMVFFVDALSAVGQEFVDGVDPAARTDEQRAVLDELCGRSEPLLLGTVRDDLRIRSSVNPASWGIDGQYMVWCGVAPEDPTQQVTGSSLGIMDGELVLTPKPA